MLKRKPAATSRLAELEEAWAISGIAILFTTFHHYLGWQLRGIQRDVQYPVLLHWEVLGWSCAEAPVSPVAFFRSQVPNERLSITDSLGRSHRHFGYNHWKSWKWAWDRQGQAIDWIDLANGSKPVNPKPSGWSKITSACASPEIQTTPRRFPTLSIKRGKWSRNKSHVRCIRYKSVFVVACLCAVSGTSNKS